MIYNYLMFLGMVYGTYAGCPPGWLTDDTNCYYFSKMKLDWMSANTFCKSFESKLTEPVTRGMVEYLDYQVQHVTPSGEFFIGAGDFFQQDSYYWHDFTPVDPNLTNWAPGEPSGGGHGSEDCICIMGNGLWNDIPCTLKSYFICEMSASESVVIG